VWHRHPTLPLSLEPLQAFASLDPPHMARTELALHRRRGIAFVGAKAAV
jgi:hypothetical protein